MCISSSGINVGYNDKILEETQRYLDRLYISIFPRDHELLIKYSYEGVIKTLSGINLLSCLKLSSGSLRESIKTFCVEIVETITEEFENDLNMFPGINKIQKLINFFITCTELHLITFDIIKNSDDNKLFSPWTIIIPEYKNLIDTYNYTYYKCLRYYIYPMENLDHVATQSPSNIGKSILIILEKFWLLFGDNIKENEAEVPISNTEILSIYGSMYNMYKFNVSNYSQAIKSDTYEEQKALFNELDVKYLETVEKVEKISEVLDGLGDQIKLVYDLSDTLEEKIDNINKTQEEFETYAGELKKFVEVSKEHISQYLSSEISSMLNNFNSKLDSTLDLKIRTSISKMEPVIKQFFVKMETEHEYKLIKTTDELLFKKDKLVSELTNKHDEYSSRISTLHQNSLSSIKEEISKIMSKSMEQHKDVSLSVSKYKDDIESYLQLKKREFDGEIKKSIEKHCKEILTPFMEQYLLKAIEVIDGRLDSTLTAKSSSPTTTIKGL